MIRAAEFATPESVNFMATHAQGADLHAYEQGVYPKTGADPDGKTTRTTMPTAFTVSIDHVDTTTGISAAERSLTALKCVEQGAKPEDFRRPGHMFPLEAKDGGVLVRTGHTEATVDLCRLAGLKECGLCC